MKSYTDIEQSKRLAEFLPIESADNVIVSFGDRYGVKTVVMPKETFDIIRTPFTDIREITMCWSFAALLSILKPINGNTYTIYGTLDGGAMITFEEVTCAFHEKEIIDAVYRMMLWLNEQNIL